MSEPERILVATKLPGSDASGVGLGAASESAASYCPRCSAKLEARSCKMLCSSCGYYMSCSDFY